MVCTLCLVDIPYRDTDSGAVVLSFGSAHSDSQFDSQFDFDFDSHRYMMATLVESI